MPSAHAIGDRIADAGGYDNNFVIDSADGETLRTAAVVHDPVSGRTIEVLTDQPGIQIYTAGAFSGDTVGKYGHRLEKYHAIALETQKFPDAMHHPAFPSIIVRPDDCYTHVCIYRFSAE